MKKIVCVCISICFLTFTISCATQSLPISPVSPTLNEKDLIDLPIEDREKLPQATFGQKVMGKGETVSADGILIDEREATRLSLIKAERDRLRAELVIEKKLRIKTDYLYQKALWESEIKFIKSQPNWFEKNDGKLGLAFGLFLGAALAIGVAASVNQVISK